MIIFLYKSGARIHHTSLKSDQSTLHKHKYITQPDKRLKNRRFISFNSVKELEEFQPGKKSTELTLKDGSQRSSDESPFSIHCAGSVCVRPSVCMCVWGVFRLRDSVWLTCWETTLQSHSCMHKRPPDL